MAAPFELSNTQLHSISSHDLLFPSLKHVEIHSPEGEGFPNKQSPHSSYLYHVSTLPLTYSLTYSLATLGLRPGLPLTYPCTYP